MNPTLSHGPQLPLTNVTGLSSPLYAGGAPVTLGLQVSSGAVPNFYSFSLSGTGNSVDTHKIASTLLQVTSSQDFSITTSGPTQSVSPGSTATFPVTITPVNGFAGSVTLAAQNLPSLFSLGYGSGNSVYISGTLNTSISVQVPSGTQPGTYPFTIQASTGGQTTIYNLPLVLVVTGGGATFSLTANPPQQTIVAGGSAAYTVTVNGTGGFTGTVAVAPGGGPPGTTITPANMSLAAGQSGTFTLQTGSSAAIGNYPITFTEGIWGRRRGLR